MPVATYQPEVDAANSTGEWVLSDPWGDTWSTLPEDLPFHVARVIPASQEYYWTRAWQEGERETLAALAAGQGVVFESPDDLVRYLLSTED